ncbi:hypothetical protein GCM10018781_24020 [Kitasatospora indigofera]|uniref:Integral membrane protein n=1 Tax=Kitasatospora indigofera TaxID=67307 RepID=A0A919FKS9_9ACTN|nr:hypothetical protein [Kitasatospora indigofera]GHH68038.1 hypothetical protein GCM10018781_24020 [Kitasatospora indigofera]
MSSGDNTGERNPFAPPPADAPDQPWQPRTPPPPAGGKPDAPETPEGEEQHPQVPPPHPWSPGYQGPWHPQPAPQQPKPDPNDPAQRRARNALMAGMAALVCALAGIPYVALFLGALAVYWAVGALRGTPKPAAQADAARTTAPAGPAAATRPGFGPTLGPAEGVGSPQSPAALAGLFTGAVAVMVTLCSIGLTMYYSDYHTCVKDALTATAEQNCSQLAPKWYVNMNNPNR